jgi:ribosomal protein L20A (L18A)
LLVPQKKSGKWAHPDYVLAKIYIEEQYWDRLLHMVKKYDLSGLQEYEKHLKARFPEEVRDLLVQKITEYADRNMGREHYQYVARTLKKIRNYPGGNEVVDKLLAEFTAKYKMRKAMMEELRGV